MQNPRGGGEAATRAEQERSNGRPGVVTRGSDTDDRRASARRPGGAGGQRTVTIKPCHPKTAVRQTGGRVRSRGAMRQVTE